MTDQITAADLNAWMLRLSKEVGNAVKELQAAGDEAPALNAEYERAWAIVYERMPVEDSVASRKEAAKNATIDEREAAGRAANTLKRCEQVLRARMAQLSALQSVAASVREEAKFDRVGPSETP
jgi:hypothetical protein